MSVAGKWVETVLIKLHYQLLQTKEMMLSNGFTMIIATGCCGQSHEEVCPGQK